MINRCHFGHVFETIPGLAGVGARCCVTSPPYWGLRDYGADGQLGLERTPEEYVANMVRVFRLVWDVLADDGTLWLNLGDSYAGGRRAPGQCDSRRRDNAVIPRSDTAVNGLKPKDLVGIPWMVAFALRADGWYLRQDIIWSKPNPMPESVRDRCTKAHEYLFLLSKRERYYFDAEAIAEVVAPSSVARLSQSGRCDQQRSARTGEDERDNEGGPATLWRVEVWRRRKRTVPHKIGERVDGERKAQPSIRVDSGHPALLPRPLRHLPAKPRQAMHPGRQRPGRHRARPVPGVWHHGCRGAIPGQKMGGVRAEPGVQGAAR